MLYEFVIVFIGVVNVRPVLFLPVPLPDKAETHSVTYMKRRLPTEPVGCHIAYILDDL